MKKEYTLNEKKLRLLFCSTVEIFLDELKSRGINIKQGVPVSVLGKILLESDKFTDFEKRDGFYIVYKNVFLDPQRMGEDLVNTFFSFCGVKNCGTDIYDGVNLENCDYIDSCTNLKNCYHCKNCRDSVNLFYCQDIVEQNNLSMYMAFNMPTSHKRFDELRKMDFIELQQQPEYKSNLNFSIITLLGR